MIRFLFAIVMFPILLFFAVLYVIDLVTANPAVTLTVIGMIVLITLMSTARYVRRKGRHA